MEDERQHEAQRILYMATPPTIFSVIPERLTISIQPDEEIVLSFQAKYPGRTMHLRPVDMRSSYQQAFNAPSPDESTRTRRDGQP